MRYQQCEEEDDGEVHNEWSSDSDHGDDLVYNLVALRCEEDEDGEEEAD